MDDLESICSHLKSNFIAMVNQHEMRAQGKTNPSHNNWPAPHLRRRITETTRAAFATWFQNTFPGLPEVKPFCPAASFRYEVAGSGSTDGVHDFKISPITTTGASGATVFNYHVQVVAAT